MPRQGCAGTGGAGDGARAAVRTATPIAETVPMAPMAGRAGEVPTQSLRRVEMPPRAPSRRLRPPGHALVSTPALSPGIDPRHEQRAETRGVRSEHRFATGIVNTRSEAQQASTDGRRGSDGVARPARPVAFGRRRGSADLSCYITLSARGRGENAANAPGGSRG